MNEKPDEAPVQAPVLTDSEKIAHLSVIISDLIKRVKYLESRVGPLYSVSMSDIASVTGTSRDVH